MQIFLALLSFAFFASGSGKHLTSLRNALLAGGWRTTDQLEGMSLQDKRDAIITEIIGHCKTWHVEHLRLSSERQLIDMVEVILFLKTQMHKTVDELKEMRFIDQREALITELNNRLERDGIELAGMTNQELVALGETMVSKKETIVEVLSLTWKLDEGRRIDSPPEVLKEINPNNCGSNVPIEREFKYTKVKTQETSFQTTDSINWKVGAKLTFSAGVPFVADAMVETSIEVGGERTWTYGGKNTISETYEDRTKVIVPGGAKTKVQASMKRIKLTIPYTMRVKTEEGAVKEIHGEWRGVTMTHSTTTQTSLPCN